MKKNCKIHMISLMFGLSVILGLVSPSNSAENDQKPSIEGTWSGTFPVGGIIGAFDVLLESTNEGGLLTFKRNFMSCKYAYAPKNGGSNGVFERVLISASHAQCAEGDIRISAMEGGKTKLEFIGFSLDPVVMNKTGGPSDTAVNSEIDILGFKLSNDLSELQSRTEAPVFSISRARSQTQGMRGDLSRYADVEMTQAEWRLRESDGSSKFAYDIIGAYGVGSQKTAGAVARVWLPEPQDAPTFDGTLSALRDKFGSESVSENSGTTGVSLTWNFDASGRVVPGKADHACNRRNYDNRTSLILRYTGIHFRLVPGNDVMVMGVPASVRRAAKKELESFTVEPRPGCGQTLRFYLQRRDNGGLKKLQAVTFAHGEFLNSQWNAERKRIVRKANQIVGTAKAQEANKPKL